MGIITSPVPLGPMHRFDDFNCGIPVLNDWLKRHALPNEASGASRTFVVCNDQRVAAYYALATGSVSRGEAPGRVKRRMPEPIPVMVLGRLAVDLDWQKQGIGPGLLKDAILRTLGVSRQAGFRAVVVHALSEEAKRFYLHHGFQESPLNQMTLMLGLADWEI